jgi:DNA helicase-2/ATP-dependent DNA helicase PcrA
LRRALADPLMDVLHRVLAVTGLEVELSASPHALAARRRETLHSFLDVAASFASLDGETTLLAFLGFLRTAAQFEKGLDSSLPGGENTVKVLTAHKSKGLEWDVVVVPGLVAKGFPSERGRELWPTSPKVLPHGLRGDAATLPDVAEWSKAGLDGFRADMKEHQRIEELRLGYVTFTRPRSLLLGSGHWWGPTQGRPFGPSAFLEALRAHCEAGDGEVEVWAERPAEDATNPALEGAAEPQWPLPLDPVALERRREAAHRVREAIEEARTAALFPGAPAEGSGAAGGGQGAGGAAWEEGDAPVPGARREPDPAEVPHQGGPAEEGSGLVGEEARVVAAWDRDLQALAGELRRARSGVREVPLPAALTATQLMRLASDPDGLAEELARPLPRPPAPAARRGTRFHAWVESRFDVRPLFAPEELPGIEPGDDIADEQDLAALKEAFLRTPYADRHPYRVEAPFSLALAGRLIRGRIDAVYRVAAGGAETYEIVDWKTGRTPHTADPLQLAIYRLAWAEQQGVPLENVTAAFVHVRTGAVVRPAPLPDRAALEALLAPEPPEGAGA